MKFFPLPEPPFVSQFEPAEDVERRVANVANEDMNAPEWNWCGMCCVRMILFALGRDAPGLEEMYRMAFDAGVFKTIDGQVVGAYHRQLEDFIYHEFGLVAFADRRRSTSDIAQAISRGRYVIASVSSAIREIDGVVPEKKSGHLVLVYAVELTEHGRTFVLHNSAGFSSLGTQTAVRITEERLRDFFSGCFITVSTEFVEHQDRFDGSVDYGGA